MPADVDDVLQARLRADLIDLAAEVTAGPGTTQRIVRAGRQRLVRQRLRNAIVVAAVVVTVMGAVSYGPTRLSQVARGLDRNTQVTDHSDSDVYESLVTRSPSGDLIDDQAFTNTVLRLWQDNRRTSANAGRGVFDDPRGNAKVVWAATTPAGPAALLVQRFFLHEHPGLGPADTARTRTVVGFVGVDAAGRSCVVGDDYGAAGAGYRGAWFIDPRHTVLAAVNLGFPMGYATGWTYAADGVRTMNFTRLPFSGTVVFARMPAGAASPEVRVSRLPWSAPADRVGVAGAGTPGAARPARLPWTGVRPIAGTNPAGAGETGVAATQGGLLDDFQQALTSRTHGVWERSDSDGWLFTGRLTDGSRILVGGSSLDSDPAHSYAVLTGQNGTQVVHGGPIDVGAGLPVIVRLPGSDGWVVARLKAALRWRSNSGPWRPAGQDAAVIPATATEVEVTPAGAPTRVVALRP